MLGRTEGERAEFELGKRLSDALPSRYTQSEVGKMLGITRQAVRRIERRALAKVAKLIMEYERTLEY
jgi:DNA-directed RNA polymerase sigma subunit (sigma70/sigma32)